jgi:hypothetical protein
LAAEEQRQCCEALAFFHGRAKSVQSSCDRRRRNLHAQHVFVANIVDLVHFLLTSGAILKKCAKTHQISTNHPRNNNGRTETGR